MLKKFASFVLDSSKSSTYPMILLEIGSAGGDFSFAKIHCKDERPTRNAVGTSSGFDSPAALPAERHVLARRGWVGEMFELFEHSAGCVLLPQTCGIPVPGRPTRFFHSMLAKSLNQNVQ